MKNLFVDRLDQLRGITSKAEFARKCGLKQTTMLGYLNGTSEPNLENLKKIAVANKVTISWLVGESEGQLEIPEPLETADYKSDSETPHTKVEVKKLEFQQNCSSRLGVLFEYIAAEYGAEGTDIENWFDDYKERDPDFREWRHAEREKKRQQRLQSDGLPDLKSANGE